MPNRIQTSLVRGSRPIAGSSRLDGSDTSGNRGQRLRLLSYNVQGGIESKQFADYFFNSWKHVLPHPARQHNLGRIARMLDQFDLVGLQEVDAGSLRSGYVDQTQFLAREGAFPHWYRQINRDLGPFAQHSNGFLSRLTPHAVTEHKLPGLPGRGVVVADFLLSNGERLGIAILHLALGWFARLRQLRYLAELAARYRYLVLMGDFNCGCDSRSLRAMVRRSGMSGLDCELKTFPSWSPRHNLDHILVSSTLRVVSAQVIDYPLSDHLPLSMTIELPPALSLVEPVIPLTAPITALAA